MKRYTRREAVIDALPYESATRIYLQSRDRYWMREGLSGFADSDHPMEIWDSTYGQPRPRGILMSYTRGQTRETSGASLKRSSCVSDRRRSKRSIRASGRITSAAS